MLKNTLIGLVVVTMIATAPTTAYASSALPAEDHAMNAAATSDLLRATCEFARSVVRFVEYTAGGWFHVDIFCEHYPDTCDVAMAASRLVWEASGGSIHIDVWC